LGEKGSVDAEVLAQRDAYEAALALYQSGDFALAEEAFQAIANNGDEASVKAVERCKKQAEADRIEPWSGVTDLTSK